MRRSAILAFPDAAGVPQARLMLERAPDVPPPIGYRDGRGHMTAAWLMCNPSDADAMIDDPTAGRVVSHSQRAGCPRSLIVNLWPLRTPYPAELWPRIERGDVSADMWRANLDAIAMAAAQADVLVVAFGAAGRRYARFVDQALEAFTHGPLHCLGVTADNMPLHPLARGKQAIRRDAVLAPWRR